ncbi:type I-E CRISPR-associated protein Cse2/CasB [Nitrospirillum sp. BR 11828]|uniref:type I-E CRISPR-associated protein Cse2/CasB n=1 Tax=Nitrospirillum sp. BR 11828 TaxID=3104325 RepID=UPI002ACAA59D|nr:type I-E CRISPR-associated protein Cse2/CasB [Nitrospirillum sp. BR 11828]MDZ5649990.1 type I-E CRISPR-associated protein Cse2/CasB [Nitrospirillum sp. BR 11828]
MTTPPPPAPAADPGPIPAGGALSSPPRDLVTHFRPLFQGWWDGLTDAANGHLNPNRAALARLRRLDTRDDGTGPVPDLATALTEEAFRRLYRTARAWQPQTLLPLAWDEALVVVAATLAHVRADQPGRKTAALLGGPDDGTPRLLAEARFLRLMRVETAAELMDQARRLVALLGRAAPVGELGASLFLWRARPQVRRAWARAYYGLEPAGRSAAAPTPSTPFGEDAPEPGAA